MEVRVMLSIIVIVTSLVLYSCQERDAEYYLKKALKDRSSCENICEKVLESFDKALELNPNYAEVYYHRAIYFADIVLGCEGFFDDPTISDLSKAIEINPQYIEAYLERAFQWDRRREYGRAVADYTKIIELSPDYAGIGIYVGIEIYYERGVNRNLIGDYTNAIADFTIAIERDPPNAWQAYYGRGEAWLHTANYDRAIADCTQAIQEYPEGRFDRAYYARGIAWRKKGDYERAMADFNTTLKGSNIYVESYFERGVVWSLKGEYDNAIRDFTEVINCYEANNCLFDEDAARFYRHRGNAWSKKGERNKALEDFKKANGVEADSYTSRGYSCYFQGKYTQALHELNKALTLASNNAVAYNIRGIIWSQKGDYERALADFTKAIEICTDFSKSYDELEWMLVKCSGDKYGSNTKVIELAQKIVEHSANPESLTILAAAYAETGNFTQAIVAQEKVIASLEDKGDFEKLTEAKKRLELYKAYKPLRE